MPELGPAPHYAAMDAAIDFLVAHYQDQPNLTEVARVAGLSPQHFQRVFKLWTGVSPKRFLQYVTLGHAKRLLATRESVLGAALETGLSGPGRLHDLFVACEAVTPGEFKRRGAGLNLRYGLHDSPFGRALLAVSDRGLCWLGFRRDGDDAALVAEFTDDWPAARPQFDLDATAPVAAQAFDFALGRPLGDQPLKLLLCGTNFQIKVWEALLSIPPGALASYQQVAAAAGQPRAARAVGRAVGANPISLIIPCHRAILKSGVLHNYRWGLVRKRRILALEAALKQAS